MERELIRYDVQLEMRERNAGLRDGEAIDLLRRELTLAQNAGRFDALAVEDIEFGVVSRSATQEGVSRYVISLELVERRPSLDDDQVAALLRRAFTAAFNASYFLRACTDDVIAPQLLSRALVDADAIAA
jgi:hypothetical protein